METILIIEDEKDLADLLAYSLAQEGFRTLLAHDGPTGLDIARNELPDLVLLDIMLPGVSGTFVCDQLRKESKTAQIPIIMVTARGEEIDRVTGFERGADDYVVKPFSVRELLLRIRAVLRRGNSVASPPIVTIGDIVIDTASHRVQANGKYITLTSTEYKLLLHLCERRGRVQSRDSLLIDVWGYNYGGDTRTVDTHVTRLRNKLGPAGDAIVTVRGFGYKVEPL